MIVILNSPLFKEKNNKYDEDSLPPIGLGYIATELEHCGHDIQLIDAVAHNLSIKELTQTLEVIKPEVFAMNVFTTNQHLVKEIVESIAFETRIVIGGLSTKDIYKDIMTWDTPNPIDIVIGDGERIIVDIVKQQVKEEPILSKSRMKVYRIDSHSIYYVKDISQVRLNRKHFVNEPVKHPFGFLEANIVTSRGCIYNCAFCAAARSKNAEFGIREKSVESIKEELRQIENLYPDVNSIRVLDDLFLKTNKSIDKSIDVFKDSKFFWRSMAHVMTFNRVEANQLLKLKHSGCRELFIGVESGSPKILRKINKTPNPSVIKRNLEMVMRAGIDVKAYFIYGFPNETEPDMELTYNLANELSQIAKKFGVSFRTSVFQFRPYHGTELYHDLDAVNQVDNEVRPVEPNTELSEKVGRLQFNFHSGNYSLVDSEILHDYIYRTSELSSGKFFEAISRHKTTIK